jgi:hypothetical protein
MDAIIKLFNAQERKLITIYYYKNKRKRKRKLIINLRK